MESLDTVGRVSNMFVGQLGVSQRVLAFVVPSSKAAL